MEKYSTIKKDDEIIFKDLTNDLELKIKHYDEDYIFDNIFINEKYELDFIEYVVKELKKTKDIGVLLAEYDSTLLENLLYKNELRISNYQYTIKKTKYNKMDSYEITNILDKEGKDFYLEMINKYAQSNFTYLYPNKEYKEYSENWFNNEEFEYRVYRKMGKVVGIVDYKNFDYNSNYGKTEKSYFSYNNKLCIRCIFSKDEQVLEEILKDLLNVFKKDIIIHFTYSEKYLKNILNNFNYKFDYCQYILVEDNKSN